jgi:hypothetical protein
MILLFGTRASLALLAVVTFVCQHCGTAAEQHVYKRTLRFTLFFIPLFPVSRGYYVECSHCGGTTALTEDQATHGVEWAARTRQSI